MAFGTHWEWRGFGSPERAGVSAIKRLPWRFPSAQRVTDEYLWIPGLCVNIKVRLQDLKFKRLVEKRGDLELWIEDARENHAFPLAPAALRSLCEELGLDSSGVALPVDRDGLLDSLEALVPGARRVRVTKVRTQHDWMARPGAEPAIVEVARISAPERAISVAFEHPERELVELAVKTFAGPWLRPLSYLEAIAIWAAGGSVR